MKRRTFIAGLGSAVTWPLIGRAQESIKIWRIGYLSVGSATAGNLALLDAFRLQLHDLGYIDGKNLRLDVRRADGDYARLPTLAAELVSLVPDVVVGGASGPTAALKRATSFIPIVMVAVADPIGSNFIKSFARPGGNITGLSTQGLETTAKSLELLHEASPTATRIAVLMTAAPQREAARPDEAAPPHEAMLEEAFAGAQTLRLTIIPIRAQTPADWDNAFTTMHNENCDALVVLADPRISPKLVQLPAQWRLPTIYQVTGYVEMGGLLTYGPNFIEMMRQAAIYVDKILNGANAADLPVEQATRLELQVNLKTAKALGLTIPDSIIARADKVIE
jgi:putative ABC transport system substrate-binding protein